METNYAQMAGPGDNWGPKDDPFHTCPECLGSGEVDGEECPLCEGQGWIYEE